MDLSKQGKNAKSRGSKWERDVAKILGDWWGKEFNRTPASGSLHWGEQFNVSGDVVTTKEAKFPFNVECKAHQGWTIDNLIRSNGEFPSWWEQSKHDADEAHKVPCIIYRRPGDRKSEAYFTCPFTTVFQRVLNKAGLWYLVSQLTYKVGKASYSYKIITVSFIDLTKVKPVEVIKDYYQLNWRREGKLVEREPKVKQAGAEDVTQYAEDLIGGLLNDN